MPSKSVYQKIVARAYRMPYLFYYCAILILAAHAHTVEIPWLGWSMLTGALTIWWCGAHPCKSVGRFKAEINHSPSTLKTFLVEHYVLLFIGILPFVIKMIFY